MRKFLTTALAALTLIAAPLATADDAFAGRKTKNTLYILGGVLGGLVLADAMKKPANARPAPQPYYAPRPQPVYYGPQPWTGEWYEYCRARYRSFDANTGYFVGYDGRARFCQ